MTQPFHLHRLDNQLTLLAEPMDWLESVALTLLVPAGCSSDPDALWGVSNLACEMVQRGCGSRDSVQFVEDLENLGVEHSASVSTSHTSFGAAMPAENLLPTLAIHADMVRCPQLPREQFEDGRQVCFQEIRALSDNLAQQAMLELRRCCYPYPFGRSAFGTLETVGRLVPGDVERHVQNMYRPNGAILSIAGRFDWPRLRDEVESLFGDWQPVEPPAIEAVAKRHEYVHIDADSTQTHIAVGFPSVPYRDPRYYEARGAVGVLSDGMSSRLFTEVREKRGLCYSVFASCSSLRDQGYVFSYAGTTADRAQQTLDVLLQELTRLAAGIADDELARLKARIKSDLIMDQESSAARSTSMAVDYHLLDEVRSLDEVGRRIDGLTCQHINDYLASHPPRDFTVVTLGSQPLEMPDGVSPTDAG